MRRGSFLVAAIVAIALLATSCELVQLDDGGYSIKPDNPNGQRLLIIGDSLIRQPSISIALSVMPGGVETLDEPVNASGLLSGPVHWETRATELINSFHPTVVLIGVVGNLSPPYWPGYGPTAAENTPDYYAWINAQQASSQFIDAYAAAAARLTTIFQNGGARVYWLEPPPYPPQAPKPTVGDRLWAKWNATLPTAAPGVRLLSARSSISDSAGNWTQYKFFCGATREIRSSEWDGGVHFTADGAGTYGRAVGRLLSQAEGWPAPPSQCPGMND